MIPARNETATIEGVVVDTLQYVDEVIVIDNGSTDETGSRAMQAGARVLHVRPSKYGTRSYLRALAYGVASTTAEVVITLDADGEHDPADIPRLVGPIEAKDSDLVFGAPHRPVRWSEGVLCRVASIRVPIRNSGAGFRAIRGDLARQMPFRGRCSCGLLAIDAIRLGARVTEVPVQLRPTGRPRHRDWFHLSQLYWVFRGLAGL